MKNCLLIIITILLLGYTHHAYACSCEPKWGVKDAYEAVQVVVIGKVIERETASLVGGYKFWLKVDKSWKQKTDKIITVLTNERDASCGIGSVQTEQDVVLYINKHPSKQDFYRASFCLRWRDLSEAKEDIKFLESKGEPYVY